MKKENNKDLQTYHTFGVPWKSTSFCEVINLTDSIKAVQYAIDQKMPLMVLGGGSNILPIDKFNGLVVHNSLMGREVVDNQANTVTIKIATGESWADLVVWSVGQGYYGLENLALIPGTVGGAIVQNIGAYDVDIARFVQTVDVINLTTGEQETMERRICDFGYRTSIFKQNPNTWMLVSVTLKLSRTFTPVLTYASLANKLGGPTSQFAAEDVMKAVIDIRQSKLPDWNVIGTAGSFFANPKVDDQLLRELKKKHPQMPVFHNYDKSENTIPAGWLIEHCHLNQKIRDDFLYEKHALILVNKLKGKKVPQKYGKQIYHASKMIVNRVQKDFGVTLIPEVVIV